MILPFNDRSIRAVWFRKYCHARLCIGTSVSFQTFERAQYNVRRITYSATSGVIRFYRSDTGERNGMQRS